MSGLQIQYLLGLYFLISSLEWNNNQFSANAIKLIAGIVLVVTAILHFSLLK